MSTTYPDRHPTTNFCVEALEEAIARYGTPEIFNTDQGSQFTSADVTRVPTDNAIKISMDGKGNWVDKVFIGRLWRSVKFEHVYLHVYESVTEAREHPMRHTSIQAQ
jgi:putative transposase